MILILIHGSIISGEFDETLNEFYLQHVKSHTTESVLKKNQLATLFQYLKNHEHEADGQVITLNDQMPVLLSQNEIKQFIQDLEKVWPMYH